MERQVRRADWLSDRARRDAALSGSDDYEPLFTAPIRQVGQAAADLAGPPPISRLAMTNPLGHES